jgi:hypothetical protein
MPLSSRGSCPDCGGTLHKIKLIDRSHYGAHQAGLLYALPEAKRSFWTATFPVEGAVTAFLCEQCARILLYGAAPPRRRERASGRPKPKPGSPA